MTALIDFGDHLGEERTAARLANRSMPPIDPKSLPALDSCPPDRHSEADKPTKDGEMHRRRPIEMLVALALVGCADGSGLPDPASSVPAPSTTITAVETTTSDPVTTLTVPLETVLNEMAERACDMIEAETGGSVASVLTSVIDESGAGDGLAVQHLQPVVEGLCPRSVTHAVLAEDPPTELGDVRMRPIDHAEMVFVPAGEFVLGTDDSGIDLGFQLCNERFPDCERVWFEDEGPPRLVMMDAFWIDQTEVTTGHYQECVDARVCRPPAETLSATRSSYYNNATYADYPVIFVAWKDAEIYCGWAGARLPSEAEWVYAARGPEGRTFPWGNDFDGTKLNFCDTNCVFDGVDWKDPDWDDGHQDTAPVGSYPDGASWVSAMDMSGNVVEWLADWYGPSPPAGDTNPTGPDSGERRSLAGGSWYDTALNERSTARGGWAPDTRHSDIGFRCAANS